MCGVCLQHNNLKRHFFWSDSIKNFSHFLLPATLMEALVTLYHPHTQSILKSSHTKPACLPVNTSENKHSAPGVLPSFFTVLFVSKVKHLNNLARKEPLLPPRQELRWRFLWSRATSCRLKSVLWPAQILHRHLVTVAIGIGVPVTDSLQDRAGPRGVLALLDFLFYHVSTALPQASTKMCPLVNCNCEVLENVKSASTNEKIHFIVHS